MVVVKYALKIETVYNLNEWNYFFGNKSLRGSANNKKIALWSHIIRISSIKFGI